MRHVEVEHRPDEGEAAGLAGEAADHLGASLHLTERSLEQVRRAPSAAVSGRVAQVHDERVEVLIQAFGCGSEAGLIELSDEGLKSLLAVLLVDRLVKRLPVGASHALALSLGQLREQVAHAMNSAVLAV